MREKFVFRHFFDVLAVLGALSEWGLACWFLGPPPAVLHVVVPPLLAVLNRLAARRLERDPATGFLLGPAGQVVCASAFAAVAAAGVLGVLASGWAVVWLLGALSAEAGVVVDAVVDPVSGTTFRALGSAAVGSVVLAVAYGYVRGHRRLRVTSIVVPLPDLPNALAGLRLVHVSDLHLGPMADRSALREALDRVAALDPDVVCVTGDLVDSPAADLDSWMPELSRLGARHGVFTILGNHDVYVGAERIEAAVRRWTGWHLLRDEVGTVEIGGSRLHLLGLEHRPEPRVADGIPGLLARVPHGEPAILLAHHPIVFPAAAAAGIRLVLAGHTHGGQLAVPGLPRLNAARLLITRYDRGCFTRDGALMHVSRGLGVSGQRVRVGVPREITVVTLVPAAAARAA
jgi:hypothetical protein